MTVIEEAVRSQTFGCENPGFCVNCGATHDECEPDAREYNCESCGKNTVYGAEELMLHL